MYICITFPLLFSCFSVLELPRDTALYIEWIDMDIETPNKDKCQGDYLRIKVSNFTKFYCGQLDGPKLLKLGPFDGTFTRKVKISFRSDNDGERGRGVKLYFYTNIQSSMFIMYLIYCNIILHLFLVNCFCEIHCIFSSCSGDFWTYPDWVLSCREFFRSH